MDRKVDLLEQEMTAKMNRIISYMDRAEEMLRNDEITLERAIELSRIINRRMYRIKYEHAREIKYIYEKKYL